ncbi:MAG: hypothetical protein LUE06_02220 [Oscillospiraceae bacterium]|nr:hypothetical protein [Oscillospiraceae bacterium]
MDKKAIETLAINAVKDSIVTSDFLDQFIADNDKEPSWDGFVYIYKDKSKKKSELKGRMAVQVKGKECDDLSKSEISYSMSLVDLKNYLSDGGAVLFVVYISSNGLENKIYYAELTPMKLRILVRDAEKQRNKSIKLKEFPNEGNKKATVFLNCWQNCQKQAGFADAKLYTVEELQKAGLLESLTIPFASAESDNPKLAILNNEVYLYANIKGSAIPQPLELAPRSLITKERVKAKISVDDRLFYSYYYIIRTSEITTLQFGESLKIEFKSSSGPCNIKYSSSSMLRVLAIDLDFMLAFIEKEYFELDDIKIPFDSEEINFDNSNILAEKERLAFVKRSVQVLDILNCSEDIDLSELSDEDFRNLNHLATALVDKEAISGLRTDLPPLLNMKVGKLKFTLFFKRDETENGKYFIYDFFKKELNVAYEGENGEMIPTSQYSIYHADDLLTINNLRPELFLISFQNAKGKTMYERANFFLLDLLTAYDQSEASRKDLLASAKEFAVWLREAPEQEIPYSIKTLNYYQVIKRERALNKAEVSELWNIAESDALPVSSKVGVYLLLEQQTPAALYFDKMSLSEQTEFKEMPIYHFWKMEDD